MRKLKLIIQIIKGESLYSTQDLVSFGNYILSDKRKSSIKKKELKNTVGDWDIANWLLN